jgi:hypothetical protein
VRCVQVLDKEFSDPRYPPVFEQRSFNEGLDVVGKDLLRFLRSAYLRRYEDVVRLTEVLDGFERMVRQLRGTRPQSGTRGTQGYTWPVHPYVYEFLETPPLTVLSVNYAPRTIWAAKLGRLPVYNDTDLYCGLSFESNSSPKLKMLESFGYVEKEEVRELLEDYHVLNFLGMLAAPIYIPAIYTYTVVKDVPDVFQGWV